MVQTPDLIRHESARMHQDDLQRGMTIQKARQNEAAGGNARFQRVAREIRHVEVRELRTGAYIVRMQHHWNVELRRGRKERLEPRIVQRHGLHRRADLTPAQTEIHDRAPQLRDGSIGILERNGSDPMQTMRCGNEGGE